MDNLERENTVLSLRQCSHKPGVDAADWYKVKDSLIILAKFTMIFCKENNLPLLFTSIIRPKIPKVSKSRTHEQGRAFDISVRGWAKDDVIRFVTKINASFKLGAVSATDGTEREAIYEDGISAGKGAHLHIQCRPD